MHSTFLIVYVLQAITLYLVTVLAMSSIMSPIATVLS